MSKKFKTRSTTSIVLSSTSGHSAVITNKEFSIIHPDLYSEAFSKGCFTPDMEVTVSDIIESVKQAPNSKDDRTRELDIALLKVALDSPKGAIDAGGMIIYRKAISLLKKNVTKAYVESLWNEILNSDLVK